MKKHGISKRIFAMLLVICMVFTMLPANVNAATYEKGDIVTGDAGASFVETDDYTRWPITIHDYSNDGMLFEYASYTGNTASWAQLDKTGEYCYLPELEAEYYADYTADAINNTQVVRRWFDVWSGEWSTTTTATQPTDNVSGLKYYTFTNFDGKHTELIDFRDPDSDDEIACYGSTVNTFDNAYGYTFAILDSQTENSMDNGDVILVESADVYTNCFPNYSVSIELASTGNLNEYRVVQRVVGDSSAISSERFSWNGNIVMVVHGGNGTNWMDRAASMALNVGENGDIVTISENKQFVTVEVPEGKTKSGVVSKEDVKYATLVYRTPEKVATTTETGSLTKSNYYNYTMTDTSQIYVFTSSDATQTPAGIAGGNGSAYLSWSSIVLECTDTTANTWQVVEVDLNSTDGKNDPSWNPIGTNRMVIMYYTEAKDGEYATSYEFFEENAKVGTKFTLSGTTLSTLQGHTTDYGTTLSGVTFSCSVPEEINGTVYPYFREAGSENLKAGAGTPILLSGKDATSDWRYVVLDISNADITDDIQSAGIYLNENTTYDFDLMVSHFALFDSKEEAEVYGEKALVVNKHHMQTIYPDNATYSTDFTTSEVVGATNLIGDWWQGVHEYTDAGTGYVNPGTEYNKYYLSYINSRQHYTFTEGSEYLPEIELIDFNSIGGVSREKLQYAVLICRTTDVALGSQFQIYFRAESEKDADGNVVAGGQTYGKFSENQPNTEDFVAVTFDLSEGFADFESVLSDQKIYSAGVRMANYGEDAYYDGAVFDTDSTFDIRQFAFFENEDQMNAYIEQITEYNDKYTGNPVSYYNPIYSNLGYGLLERSSEGKLYDKYEVPLGYVESGRVSHATAEDQIYYLEYKDADVKMSDKTYDGYTLYGTLTGGGLTAGLLEGTLGEDGNPVYRDETIEYLAKVMETTLVIPEYEGGYFNYDFVRGEKSEAYGNRDLAAAIRECVGIDFTINDKTVNDTVVINGTTYKIADKVTYNDTEYTVADYDINNPLVIEGVNYITGTEATNAKVAAGAKLKGTWAECKDSIKTCYDAAYFLLNSLFVENSYNETQTTETANKVYESLTLRKATIPAADENSEAREAYVFDAGLTSNGDTALDYNDDDKLIDFAGVTGKDLYATSTTTTTTLFPFLPVQGDNTEEGMTKSPYFADPGVGYDGTYGETYYERDFNYVIESHGQFVYQHDADLFFEFEGDDDVYLFINGQLVLDIGGAHGITKVKFNLNDYVDNDVLSLTDEQICDFDFFYMERHGYGANCRIVTNMVISDPALLVDKTAWQNEQEVPYGGVIEPKELVEYQFTLENHGDVKLYNMSFIDSTIGVAIDKNGLHVTGDHVTDKDESTLDAADLSYEIKGYRKLDTDEVVGENVITYNRINGKMEQVTGDSQGEYVYSAFSSQVKDEAALKKLMYTLETNPGETETGENDAQVTHSGSGLWVDASLTIKGIYYKLTDDQIKAGKFNNVLIGEATSKLNENDDQYKKLTATDTHRVVVPGKPYYYQWSGHNIVITKERLVDDMRNSGDKFDELFNNIAEGKAELKAENINKIIVSASNGAATTIPEVSVDDANNITVKYNEPRGHLFYVKITYNKLTQEAIVPIIVNTTKVEYSYMVLDYGLSVELTKDDELLKNDILHVGTEDTTAKVVGVAKETSNPSYSEGVGGSHTVTITNVGEVADANNEDNYNGAFTLVNNKLTYTPDELMEKIDTIWTAVHVYEDSHTPTALGDPINIGKEVQMLKKVSVLPANVVYYEDDFPAIQYKDKNGVDITTNKEIFERVGSSKDLTQSADQDQEYGQDDEYRTNSTMSGNSLTKIKINESGQVATFNFKGTGFELISQTNATDSATILVQVTDSNGNRTIPVITEFDHIDNGDGGNEGIYQVPVIRIDGLTYEQHTVTIYAAKGVGRDAMLYVDGFRIYQPYGDSAIVDENTDDEKATAVITPGQSEHYNDSENGAVFSEIRNLIMDAQAVVASYTNTTTTINSGTVTWTERHTDKHYNGTPWTSTNTNSINDYLLFGPNNEVYMDGTEDGNTSALVFYVTEDKVGEGSLQIAVRAIDKALFEGTKASTDSTIAGAKLSYGIYVEKAEENEKYQWKAVETIEGAEAERQGTISSATEQYYTINYRECPYLEGRGYQVAIKVTGGMVSYSSIKSSGLTFKPMNTNEAETTTLEFRNGELVNTATNKVAEESAVLLSLRRSLATDVFYEEEISVDEKICYQTRNDSDVRLIGYVDDLTKYSSVSFTLTFNGKVSNPLVCTTAYSGLYANGELKTTKDIYGVDGHFVTFTINNFLKACRGQEVKITITYTSTTGEVHTEARTIMIE